MVTVRSRCIAVSNQKGGVGKTVSCVNLGIGLAQEGKKVLLIDADPQGSLTISLGYEEPDEMEYSLATLMMNIVKDEKLNMEKVMSMLLIHDLGEIYAGDTWVFDDEKKVHAHDRELASIEKTMSFLPEATYLNMKNSWLEFEKGQSPEARYARVIDALVPLVNHLEVSESNYNPDNISSDMVLEKKKFIKGESKELWKLTEELVQESVEKGLYL